MSTLALRNVTYYQTKYQKVDALKDISHHFDMGLLRAVAGPRCSCWIRALPRPRACSAAL